MSVAIVLGLLWFQIERTHETIKERMGYVGFMHTYFVCVYVCVHGHASALTDVRKRKCLFM